MYQEEDPPLDETSKIQGKVQHVKRKLQFILNINKNINVYFKYDYIAIFLKKAMFLIVKIIIIN